MDQEEPFGYSINKWESLIEMKIKLKLRDYPKNTVVKTLEGEISSFEESSNGSGLITKLIFQDEKGDFQNINPFNIKEIEIL